MKTPEEYEAEIITLKEEIKELRSQLRGMTKLSPEELEEYVSKAQEAIKNGFKAPYDEVPWISRPSMKYITQRFISNLAYWEKYGKLFEKRLQNGYAPSVIDIYRSCRDELAILLQRAQEL
ncbi:MAG: hypothetical protein ACFFCQ_00510 [Promethearchaeota archaeon]